MNENKDDKSVMDPAPIGTPRTRRLLRGVTRRTQRGHRSGFMKQEPITNEDKDRSLPGKDRIRARKAARR